MQAARRTQRPNGTELRIQKELIGEQEGSVADMMNKTTVGRVVPAGMLTQSASSATGVNADQRVRD